MAQLLAQTVLTGAPEGCPGIHCIALSALGCPGSVLVSCMMPQFPFCLTQQSGDGGCPQGLKLFSHCQLGWKQFPTALFCLPPPLSILERAMMK